MVNRKATRRKDDIAKIIVLTDLHMTPVEGTIIGIDPYERLRSAVEHINAHHADARHVIVLGDLTHGGDVASYQRVRELTNRLHVPVSFMMGNHDHRESFFEVFEGEANPQGFLQAEIRIGTYRLLLLDTRLDEPLEGVGSASGHLCSVRLNWLEQRLRAAEGEPVVLFMHHPPMATGFPGMDKVKLHTADQLLSLINRFGNVRQIVAGHIHRTISGSWHGVPFAVLKSPVHQQPLDFVSLSSCLSVDEPGAYGVILLTDTELIVHTEDYDLARHSTRSETVMSKLNYWDDKWDLDEKQCPCDVHLLDYLAETKRTGADIFHMGTGSHHIVGLRTAADGSNTHVLGITSSPQEYQDYIKLLIDNPRLGFTYKVYFGDIYQIDHRLMPELDIATLFHIGEFRTEHNEAYGALTNVDMAQVLVDRLRPGGELIFYAGSFAYDQAAAAVTELLSRGVMEDAGRFKTLHILRKRRG